MFKRHGFVHYILTRLQYLYHPTGVCILTTVNGIAHSYAGCDELFAFDDGHQYNVYYEPKKTINYREPDSCRYGIKSPLRRRLVPQGPTSTTTTTTSARRRRISFHVTDHDGRLRYVLGTRYKYIIYIIYLYVYNICILLPIYYYNYDY